MAAQGDQAVGWVSLLATEATEAVPTTPLVLAAALGVALVVLVVLLLSRRGGRPGRREVAGGQPAEPSSPCPACGKGLLASWSSCPFCGWAPPPPPAVVEFVEGSLKGRVFALDADITTVGTLEGNSIVLGDPEVSKKHLGIRRDPVGYELADLGSASGVLVNGQRLAKRILASGDIIRIGTSEMVFRIEKVG